MITQAEMEKVTRALADAELAVHRWDRVLEKETYQKHIDEIALMVGSDPLDFLTLKEGLEECGWSQFNEARDSVRTAPIRSLYSVRYFFFNHPDKAWRFEIMKLEEGISPLHCALAPAADQQRWIPVHASFKCSTEERYAFSRTALERLGLFEAQRCDSTYGRFSYYIDLGRNDAVPYVKPRVNLRDMPEELR